MKRPFIESFEIDSIHISETRMHLNEDAVVRLMDSIRERGLMTPISIRVRSMVIDCKEKHRVPRLITGHHRLEAMKRLGHKKIPAIELPDDDIEAELWEIDENLCRAELTPAEEARCMARREELWVAKNNAASCGENRGRGRPKKFAQETAEKTGLSKDTIHRAVTRG